MYGAKIGPVEFGRSVRKWLHKGEWSPDSVLERVQEAFYPQADGERVFDPMTVPLVALAQGMVGENWASALKQAMTPGLRYGGVGRVAEATESTDASAFSNITGQLLIRILQEGYDSPAFIGDQLTTTLDEPMSEAILGTLKVPDITGVLAGPSQVQPGMTYPAVGIKEDWITLPKIEKWGYRLPITLEALAQDRTGRLQDAAKKLGLRLRIDREERQLRPILGMTNPFVWQDVSYSTYGAPVGPTGQQWTNQKTGISVATQTWELLNAQIQLFVQMMDPFTGKPIAIDYNRMQILCMPESIGSFFQVVNAASVNTANATTSAWTQMVGGGNPFGGKFSLLSSPYARNLLTVADSSISWSAVSATSVKDYWYMGDFKTAFAYRQWLAMQTFTMPPMSEDEFNRDIIFHVKCREAGSAGVMNPRYASQSKNA